MAYHVTARAYAKRARNRLNEGTRESLFYAAFELRAGVEGRLQEYLNAQESVAQHKKEAWQIGKLARYLEEAFSIGDQIVQVAVFDPEAGELIEVLYYTPVSSQLQADAKQLGELLHGMLHYKADEHPWWRETRQFLLRVVGELERACAGTLLAPPLREPGTNRMRITSEIVDKAAGARLRAKLVDGFSALMNITYLEELPRRGEPLRLTSTSTESRSG